MSKPTDPELLKIYEVGQMLAPLLRLGIAVGLLAVRYATTPQDKGWLTRDDCKKLRDASLTDAAELIRSIK